MAKDERFYVIAEDDSLAPRYRRGERVPMRRETPPEGGVGLFYLPEGLKFKRLVRDWAGNLYLTPPKGGDPEYMLPTTATAPLCCFGMVEED